MLKLELGEVLSLEILWLASQPFLCGNVQVKIAEHVLTQHKVAIKILNRRKIKQMDMEEKGLFGLARVTLNTLLWFASGCVLY